MTKPRFISEPVPDGLDPDLAAYLQRQFDRIHDWWPKDAEGRVQALEEIQPALKGEWPIVDYSYVSFNSLLAAELSLTCANDVDTLSEDDFPAGAASVGPQYSPTTNALYLATTEFSVNPARIIRINLDTDAVTTWTTLPDDFRAANILLYSSSGVTAKDRLVFCRANGSSGRLYNFYSLTSGFLTSTSGTSFSNAILLAENENYIIARETVSHIAVLNKSTYARVTQSSPTGFSRNETFAARNRANYFLMNFENSSTGQFYFVEYSGTGAIPTPTITVSTDVENFDARPIVANNKIFWPVRADIGSGTQACLLVTNTSGTTLDIVYTGMGASWVNTQDTLSTNDAEDYIYYANGTAVHRMSTDDYTYESCSVTLPSIPGLDLSGGVWIYRDKYYYYMDHSTKASTKVWIGNVLIEDYV